jgi:hypothetical protein
MRRWVQLIVMAIAALALASSLWSWGSAHLPLRADGLAAVVGTVTGIDPTTGAVTLSTSSGRLTLALTPETEVHRGSVMVSLGYVDEAVGQPAKVRYSASGDTPTAYEIRFAATRID